MAQEHHMGVGVERTKESERERMRVRDYASPLLRGAGGRTKREIARGSSSRAPALRPSGRSSNHPLVSGGPRAGWRRDGTKCLCTRSSAPSGPRAARNACTADAAAKASRRRHLGLWPSTRSTAASPAAPREAQRRAQTKHPSSCVHCRVAIPFGFISWKRGALGRLQHLGDFHWHCFFPGGCCAEGDQHSHCPPVAWYAQCRHHK